MPFRRRRSAYRPPIAALLELLEDRTLLAAAPFLRVNTTADIDNPNDGLVSLREAVRAANNNTVTELGDRGVAGGDVIAFTADILDQFVNVAQGELLITEDLVISNTLTTDMRQALNANETSRFFQVASGVNLTLQRLDLYNGKVSGQSGGAVLNFGNVLLLDCNVLFSSAQDGAGGAIRNEGTLEILNSTFSGNRTLGDLGGAGGAISNSGTVRVQESTFENNTANLNGGAISNDSTGSLGVMNSDFFSNRANATLINGTPAFGSGGALDNAGTLTVFNSTLDRNLAYGDGGAINTVVGGQTTIRNATITGNHADNGGNGAGTGGGVGGSGSTTLYNTIVTGNFGGAYNTEAPNDLGPVNSASSYNIIGEVGSNTGLSNPANHNIIGVAVSTVIETFPGDHGGRTLTYRLIDGSPAIDAGSNAQVLDLDGNQYVYDQRAKPFVRFAGAAVDIGAYERQGVPFPLVVDNTSDVDDGDYTAGQLSLREAVLLANEGEGTDTITFDTSLTGMTIELFQQRIFVRDNVSIVGLGARNLTIGGRDNQSLFDISEGITANFRGLTFADGRSLSSSGGAFQNQGTLVIADSTFRDNRADFGGGAIDNRGTLKVTGSTFTGSTTGAGVIGNGAYGFLTGALLVSNSTFSGNGIVAISNDTGSAILRNTTLTGNDVGIQTVAGNNASTTLFNTIVAGNTSDVSGDALTGNSGFNIIGNANTAGGLTNGTNGNIVGVAAANVLDPVLANNGGPTDTHALIPGSRAIDAGSTAQALDPNAAALMTDQRGTGYPRANGRVDIGAYESELQAPLPDPLIVDTDSDIDDAIYTAGNLSLREAVRIANDRAGSETISFATSLTGRTIKLNGGQLRITDDVTITGLGAASLTISGENASRIFQIDAGVTVNISGLKFTKGNAGSGGAIGNAGVLTVTGSTLTGNRAGSAGGAIGNSGTLTVTDSTFSGNTAGYIGGAIDSSGLLNITGSTFVGNTAFGGNNVLAFGGAIDSNGTLKASNSTFSGNTAAADGGAIYNYGTATLRNVTLTNNRADADGVGGGAGGGISTQPGGNPTTTLFNTIVAGNFSGPGSASSDLEGKFVESSSGFNLIGDPARAGNLKNGTNGNIVGIFAADVLDPVLRDNGGPTLTHALISNCAADRGSDAQALDPNGKALTTDQRGPGFGRKVGTVDIGAYERQPLTIPLIVSALGDIVDGNYAAGQLTLREAILLANRGAGADTITFDAARLSGKTITVTGSLPLYDDITIVGLGAGNLTISGGTTTGIFHVGACATASLSGLTLTGGNRSSGGAIFNKGKLTVTASVFSGNTAVIGGAITSEGKLFTADTGVTLTVTDTAFSGNNSGGSGGAIFARDSMLSVNLSTFSGNTGSFGGAIATNFTASLAPVTITDTTFSGNNAGFEGGAISLLSNLSLTNSTFNDNRSPYGGAISNRRTLSAANSTFSGNTATESGGGIFNAASATLRNVTLTNNRADSDGNGIGLGGGINTNTNNTLATTTSATTLFNTIVAGNFRGIGSTSSDLEGKFVESGSGFNLIGDPAHAGNLKNGSNGNIVGIAASDVLDPVLRDNGGPTKTHALISNCAADRGSDVQALDPKGNALTTDQRGPGFLRFVGRVDIGAYERQPLTIPLIISALGDVVDGNYAAGQLTLREAVLLANSGAGADTITFDASLNNQVITVAASLPLYDNITLVGLGADRLTISGGGATGIFHVGACATVSLSGLTLTGGNRQFGGAISNRGKLTVTASVLSGNKAIAGGAIISSGNYNGDVTLTVTDTTFSGNIATASGAAIDNRGSTLSVGSSIFSGNKANSGGAILTAGISNIANSTFNGNTADLGGAISASSNLFIIGSTFDGNRGGTGGAIYTTVSLSAANSTFSGNTATRLGGGIYISRLATLRNVTIAKNRADADGDGTGQGGGLFANTGVGNAVNAGTVTLYNTIVAGNFRGTGNAYGNFSDLEGKAVETASRNNIVADIFTDGGLRNVATNSVGGFSDDIIDPVLRDNGGPTKTHALIGKRGTDGGNNSLAPAGSTDQRGPGFGRSVGGRVDVGAFERQLLTIPLVVDTAFDIDNGIYTAGDLSLREAVRLANSTVGAAQITFANSLANQTILLDSQLAIYDDTTIVGLGAKLLTISGQNASRIFFFSSGVTAALSGVTLTGGNGFVASLNTASSSIGRRGGAIFNSGSLSIDTCVLSGNSTTSNGGAIDNFGTLSISGSTLSGNAATKSGGAISNFGTLAVGNSTFSGNSADDYGGGIYNGGTATLRNVTLTNNRADADGVNGGASGGIHTGTNGNTLLYNTIVAGNLRGVGNAAAKSDLQGQSVAVASSNNLIGNYVTVGGLQGGANGNILYDFVSQILDPVLRDNGGPTMTHALVGGLAADAGDDDKAPGQTDQRGLPLVGKVDIGAFERQPAPFPLIVTTTADVVDANDSLLSLREAVDLANRGAGADTISFATSLTGRTIALSYGLEINDAVTITGAGVPGVTLGGGGTSLFLVNGFTSANFVNLTVTGVGQNGAIFNFGKVNITDSTFRGNTSGAITNLGMLSIVGSTFSGNSTATSGGAISNFGTLTVANSTFSGNTADGLGGAIYNGNTATLRNVTIAKNRADADGVNGGASGGIHTGTNGNTLLYNTIVAGNFRGTGNAYGNFSDLEGKAVETASRNNIVADIFTDGGLSNVATNSVGGFSDDIIDPVLRDNGGPTKTHALIGKRGTDGGNNSLAPAGSTDQRGPGFGRSVGGRVDVGAFERQPLSIPLVVTTTADVVNANDGVLSLREAVDLANRGVGADTITFDAGLAGGTILLGSQLSLYDDTTIVGLGANRLTLSGQNANRIVYVNFGVTASLSGLTLTGGNGFEASLNTSSSYVGRFGAAIFNRGTLAIDASIFSGNNTTSSGGAIGNYGLLSISGSTFNGNTAGNAGGAIRNYGTLNLANGTFSGNTAVYGGALFNDFNLTISNCTFRSSSATAAGGAIGNAGTLSLTDSTFAGNTATDNGGAISNTGTLSITSSTLSGNTAQDSGGAIISIGTLSITSSTFNDNRSAFGGAIYNKGLLAAVSSTLSGNTASRFGGGIFNVGTATLRNATITQNRVISEGNRNGGGIHTNNAGTTTLYNTIVAGNFSGTGGIPSDLDGKSVDLGSSHNLIGSSDTAGGLTAGDNGNIVGVDALIVLDPVLRDNGGPTLTHALVGRIAADAGDDTFAPEENDQRGLGFSRKVGTVDIGAFERQVLPFSLVVSSLDDAVDGKYGPGELTLREAILLANRSAGADTITFANSLSGGTIKLGRTLPLLNDPLTITGLGAGRLTISGGNLFRIFNNYFDVRVGISGLNLVAATESAISNYGTMTILASTFSGNSSDVCGGAVHNNGTLEVVGSTFSGNTSMSFGGGAICNGGTLNVSDSTFRGNAAEDNPFRYGGGAIINFGRASITGSTFQANSAVFGGGAITNNGTLFTANSTFSRNNAGDFGGGIFNIGVAELRNVTLTNNRSDSNGNGTGDGGGVHTNNAGTTTLYNTIVAGNFRGTGNSTDDLNGKNVATDSRYNLIGDSGTPGGLTNSANRRNIVGVAVATVLDPVLRNNGGSTMTHALISGSRAVNAGSSDEALTAAAPNSPALQFDQRGPGFARVVGANVDIGAVERQTLPAARFRPSLATNWTGRATVKTRSDGHSTAIAVGHQQLDRLFAGDFTDLLLV